MCVTATHMASSFLLISLLLLLEVWRLLGFVLAIKFPFAHIFVLVLEFIGLEIPFLHQVGNGSSLMDTGTCVFRPRLLFHIKSANEIHNSEFLSLVFQRSSKIPPRGREFGNDASGHKLVR